LIYVSDHETTLLEVLVHLLDRLSEACVSEVQVVLHCVVPVLLRGLLHDLLQARVDDVDLTCASQLLHVRRSLRDLVAHRLNDLNVLLLSVLLRHSARGDVVQILQPLEVGTGDTTSVGKHVWHHDDATLFKGSLGTESGGAVCTLEDDLAVQLICVVLIDSFLLGGGDQDITLLFHELEVVELGLLNRTVEAEEGATRRKVVFHSVDIQAVRVVDRGVVLDDADDLCAVLLEEFGCPVADRAETLHYNGLASDALRAEERPLDEGVHVEQLLDTVVDTETCGLGTALDTTLGWVLTGGAPLSVDVVLTVHANVGIFDPGHDLLVGAKIGTETVDLRPDESFLGELHRVSSGDLLELALRILLGVDLNATLGTTEGHISNRQFESHQRCQSHHLLQIHIGRESSAALNRQFVVLVLSTVADDVIDGAVVETDGNGKPDDVVAGANQLKVVLGDAGLGCGSVEEELDLLEETRLFGRIAYLAGECAQSYPCK